MKITLMKPTEVDAKWLKVDAGVRYWEDAIVNGERDGDDNNPRMPFADPEAGSWRLTIDLETGLIEGWPAGVTAQTHYKVCDDGVYSLLDAVGSPIAVINGYVPEIMCPGGDGYGDYIIMSVGGDGRIADWRPDISVFRVTPE